MQSPSQKIMSVTEEEAVTQTIKGLVAGADTRPRKQYTPQTKEKKTEEVHARK